MPLVIPPLFAQISIRFRNDNDPEPWYITFGANCQDTDDDLTLIGERALYAMTVWLDLISQDTHMEGADVAYGAILDDPPVRAFIPPDADYSGTHDVPKLPQNCALLVSKQTAKGGRQHRGRFFMPGILTEEGVSNVGVIDAGDHSSYQLHASDMLDNLNDPAHLLPMVILHNSAPLPVPDPTPVTSLAVSNVISTQRRRLR